MKIKLLPILLIFFTSFSRFLPHPPNFAPISAIALFGAVYLPKKYAFLMPVLALLTSDLIIGFYGQLMFFVYGSFLISALIGLWVRNHKNVKSVIGASLISSILFFLITNAAVWIDPASSYPKGISGLIQSYIAGIPFFRGTISGDLFFVTVLFGGYELVTKFAKKYLPSNLSQNF